MELDDLKNTWKQERIHQNKTQNIMEMIHHESLGPVAMLKKKFKRRLIFISVLIIITALTFLTQLSIGEKVWFFISIMGCLIVFVNTYSNYELTSELERRDGPVKAQVESYVATIEKRLKRQYNIEFGFVLLLGMLIEIAIHFYHGELAEAWNAVNPLVRLASYILFFVVLYLLTRYTKWRDFDRHVNRLKNLLNELN